MTARRSWLRRSQTSGEDSMQEFYPAGLKRCFACIQWDGRRSYDKDAGKIKADAGIDGWCRMKHNNTRGSHCCDDFTALR